LAIGLHYFYYVAWLRVQNEDITRFFAIRLFNFYYYYDGNFALHADDSNYAMRRCLPLHYLSQFSLSVSMASTTIYAILS